MSDPARTGTPVPSSLRGDAAQMLRAQGHLVLDPSPILQALSPPHVQCTINLPLPALFLLIQLIDRLRPLQHPRPSLKESLTLQPIIPQPTEMLRFSSSMVVSIAMLFSPRVTSCHLDMKAILRSLGEPTGAPTADYVIVSLEDLDEVLGQIPPSVARAEHYSTDR